MNNRLTQEDFLIKLCSKNSYYKNGEFEGYSECYKIENFKEIYEEFKKITEDYITEKI